ncbi:MAG: DUF6468 domain-containing protein [Micavibrio sp.]
MEFSLALLIDISILVLLVATVFFAFRLSHSLKSFRQSREAMEELVTRLVANITQAENAVGGMQNVARKTGLELDEIISDAKSLADELKIMNESGNSLADRLEELAERNSALLGKIESAPQEALVAQPEPIRYNNELPRVPNVRREVPATGFAIRDRDFYGDEEDFFEAGGVMNGGREEEAYDEDEAFLNAPASGVPAPGLQSQAERELFEALQSGKSRLRGRA